MWELLIISIASEPGGLSTVVFTVRHPSNWPALRGPRTFTLTRNRAASLSRFLVPASSFSPSLSRAAPRRFVSITTVFIVQIKIFCPHERTPGPSRTTRSPLARNLITFKRFCRPGLFVAAIFARCTYLLFSYESFICRGDVRHSSRVTSHVIPCPSFTSLHTTGVISDESCANT